ncbi:hypothetical protein P3102_37530 [Amycolatopsis sp. QT-25]|uniref:hypothetical protein n=1 Tax=Amycolatopsis sp. QT-25 TaxID=3034022 RepID=UPI0023EC05E1|nr:hypothetical protein [Amycolatopsis sp. QT-25]WET79645.1 hypothetical protein P3102_37530 [Amycolatopsis sp. QT-25]
MTDDRLVISRTPAVFGHLVLVVLFSTLTAVMVFAVFSDQQLAVRIVCGVLCAVFVYCGTIELRNYRTPPPADELVVQSAGITRIENGLVSWTAPWGDIEKVVLSLKFREYTHRKPGTDRFMLVLRPGPDFDARSTGLTREPDGDLQISDVDLSSREAEQLLPVLVRYVEVEIEDDNCAVAPKPDEPIVDAARERGEDLVIEDDAVKIHVNGWDKRKLKAFHLCSLMIEVCCLVVAAATDVTAVRVGAFVVLFGLFVVTMVVDGFESETHKKERMAVLELGPRGFFLRTYGSVAGVWWHEIDAVRWGVDNKTRYLEFLPASKDFSIRHPRLATLTRRDRYDEKSEVLDGGWYRLAEPFTANARREFESAMSAARNVEFRETAVVG